MWVDQGRAGSEQGSSVYEQAGLWPLVYTEPPDGLLSLLEFVLGLLQVFAHRCHAFLSLPKATWQIKTK